MKRKGKGKDNGQQPDPKKAAREIVQRPITADTVSERRGIVQADGPARWAKDFEREVKGKR